MVEVEGRKDSLEKELATKDSYIRELEDIIVEKVSSSHQYCHFRTIYEGQEPRWNRVVVLARQAT
jgi:hypothetical protein